MHCWTAQFIYKDIAPFTHEFSLLFNLKVGATGPTKTIANEDLEAQFYPWRAGTDVDDARGGGDILQVAKAFPDYPLDSKVRHELFCTFKEALNNVIRHSGATEVQLVFEVVEERLSISILDNGRGFELDGAAPGKDGLASLGQRMRRLGGDCQITSKPGQGTNVELRLPLRNIQYGQNRNR